MEYLLKYFIRKSIANQDVIEEDIIPMINRVKPSLLKSKIAWLNSTNPAKVIAGRPTRNENLAEEDLLKPEINDDEMVIPERDTPGISANTWLKPIKIPSLIVIFSKVLNLLPIFSAKASVIAITTDTKAIIGIVLKEEVSYPFQNNLIHNPVNRIGILPNKIAAESFDLGSV